MLTPLAQHARQISSCHQIERVPFTMSKQLRLCAALSASLMTVCALTAKLPAPQALPTPASAYENGAGHLTIVKVPAPYVWLAR
ncbi:hypothetical protein [Alteripontixanthobacter maritimus]|nr:hypothetical protein [Alteripontixanthobacter maritimus]